MNMNIETIRSFSDAIKRSTQFTRAAIRLKKIEAKMVGNQWLIPSIEIKRFRKDPFKISREEMQNA